MMNDSSILMITMMIIELDLVFLLVVEVVARRCLIEQPMKLPGKFSEKSTIEYFSLKIAELSLKKVPCGYYPEIFL